MLGELCINTSFCLRECSSLPTIVQLECKHKASIWREKYSNLGYCSGWKVKWGILGKKDSQRRTKSAYYSTQVLDWPLSYRYQNWIQRAHRKAIAERMDELCRDFACCQRPGERVWTLTQPSLTARTKIIMFYWKIRTFSVSITY